MIRRTATLVAGALAILAPGLAQAQDAPHYRSAQELRASVAKTVDGAAAAPVPTGDGAVVLIAHRTRTGEVEVHAKLHDEFIVQEGRATVLVGGRAEGGREVAPGEWRGGAIVGGQSHDMGPGDVLWIPAGAPHQVVLTPGGSFVYLAIKFEAKPKSQP